MALSVMASAYRKLLEEFCTLEIVESNDDEIIMSIEGVGGAQLAAYEKGIHLIVDEENNQVPLWVDYFSDLDSARSSYLQLGELQILRMILLPVVDNDESKLTDFRTGLVFTGELTNSDWKLLLAPAYEGGWKNDD